MGFVNSEARAEGAPTSGPRSSAPEVQFKLWVVPPFSQLRADNLWGEGAGIRGVTFLSASLAIEFRETFVVELGGGPTFAVTANFPVGFDVFARSGWVPVISDWRSLDGQGWTIQFDALAGYRWLKRDITQDYIGSEQTHALRADLGFEFARHSGAQHALAFRVLTGFSLPMLQTRTGAWQTLPIKGYIPESENLKWALDLGFNVGIAF